MGLLCHPVLESMIKSRASEFRGNYYSHGKQFIENLPVRIINFEDAKEKAVYDRVVLLVRELIKTKETLKSVRDYGKKSTLARKLARLNTELRQLINNLYTFSEEDIKCITGSNLFVASIEE
jgi:hypothetical protein